MDGSESSQVRLLNYLQQREEMHKFKRQYRPGKEQPYKQMEEDSIFGVECGKSVSLRIFLGAYWAQCTLLRIHGLCGHLCFIPNRKMPPVEIMILRVLMWNRAFLKGGPFGVDHVIFSALLSMSTVMQVAMVMLMGYIQRRIVVWYYMLLHRRIVLVRAFSSDVAVLWRRHFGRIEELKVT